MSSILQKWTKSQGKCAKFSSKLLYCCLIRIRNQIGEIWNLLHNMRLSPQKLLWDHSKSERSVQNISPYFVVFTAVSRSVANYSTPPPRQNAVSTSRWIDCLMGGKFGTFSLRPHLFRKCVVHLLMV